jgi:adenylate cyclase
MDPSYTLIRTIMGRMVRIHARLCYTPRVTLSAMMVAKVTVVRTITRPRCEALMHHLLPHLPSDRLQALIRGTDLPLEDEGSVLFADLTGFTPLTEHLLHHFGARRGAEELTQLLDAVYAPLIANVHGYGGSVISFSGDAITCWFPGRDAQPTIACGLAMQQAMAPFAIYDLAPHDQVSLTLKVAIATGPVQRFIVGDPTIQRIDILAGAPLARLTVLDPLARPGEVLVDAGLARSLHHDLTISAWRTDTGGDQGAVVTGLRSAVGWDAHRPSVLAELPVGLDQWVAPTVLARLADSQATFLTELRPTVALFLRFGIHGTPIELDAYIRWVQHVLRRYAATLLQVSIGDKGNSLYAAFGAPIAHEDDAIRAVRAARELRDSPHAVQTTGIGLAAGIARTGVYGSPARRTYGVLGDAVNLAARLMQAAQPGQILASDRVWEATAAQVHWQPLPPLTVKGKLTAILAASLLSVVSVPQPGGTAHRTRSPLVGRAAELVTLRAQLDQAAPTDPGQVLAISGPAGIGKSRLVEELVCDLPATWQVVQSATQSYGTASPYLAWIPVWQHVFAVDPAATLAENLEQVQTTLVRLAPDSLPQLPLLSAVLALPIPDTDLSRVLDPRLRKTWLETMLIQCLRSYLAEQTARGQRLLLILEDLHWLDQLSADLLDQVVATLDRLPLTLVLTARTGAEATPVLDGVIAAPQAYALHLGELDGAAIDQLLATKLAGTGAAITPDHIARLSAQIAQQAGGNPFYAEELITYLGGAGVALDDRRGWHDLELPVGLHRLVLSRVDRLTPHVQRVLKTASILGASFRRAWLVAAYPALGGAAAVEAALVTLEAAMVLAPSADPALAQFKHAITREVIYESLSQVSRGALHEQVAAHLEQADAAEHLNLLAYHYERSPNDGKAITYLARNAARAASLFANIDAVHQYQAALERAGRPAVASPLPVADLAGGLGDVYAQMAEFDAALEQYAQAGAALEDVALERAALSLRRADVLVRATRFDDAIALIEQTEASLAPYATTKPARVILAQLANLRSIKDFRQGAMQQALEWAEHGLRSIAALPRTYPLVVTTRIRLSEALVAAAATHTVGNYVYAQKVLNNALRLIRRHPHPVVEGELQLRKAVLSMSCGKLHRAVRQFRQALPLIEATGTRDRVAHLLIAGGRTLTLRGEFQEARDWFQRARSLGEATGATFLVSASLHLLGWIDVMTGAWDTALLILREGKALAFHHDLRDRLVSLMIFEGQIYMYRGEYERCDALFGEALDLAVHHQLADMAVQCHHNRAYSALIQNQLDRSRSYRPEGRFTGDRVRSFDEALDRLSSAEWWAMVSTAGAAAAHGQDPELVATDSRNSVQFLRQHGYRSSLPFGYRVHAMVAHRMGNRDEAWQSANEGVRVGKAIGRLPELARSLVWRARTELDKTPGSAQAHHDLYEAAHYFEQFGAAPESTEVRRLLTTIW